MKTYKWHSSKSLKDFELLYTEHNQFAVENKLHIYPKLIGGTQSIRPLIPIEYFIEILSSIQNDGCTHFNMVSFLATEGYIAGYTVDGFLVEDAI